MDFAQLSLHLRKNFEWFFLSALWFTTSILATENYVGTVDVVTKYLVILLGLLPLAVAVKKPATSSLDFFERIQLRWVTAFVLLMTLLAIPFTLLILDPPNLEHFAESQLIVSAPLFGLTYHFISVANSILLRASRLPNGRRKDLLKAVSDRNNDGALLIGTSAVLSAFSGLTLRYSLIIQSSPFSVYLLRVILILLINGSFALGFFRATKVSRWFEI